MATDPEANGTLQASGFAESTIADFPTRINSPQPSSERVKRTRPKRAKSNTRLKRTQHLQGLVANLVNELKTAGFVGVMPVPAAVELIGPEIDDPKTHGKIGHVQEPLGTYIQRVSVEDNFFQRSPFDHVTDPIYRRLIRDFVDGAAMPESKIAALNNRGNPVFSLSEEDVRFSVIDGLQRLHCFLIALLLVWRREQLVQEGYIPQEAWEFFAASVHRCGEPQNATEALLRRTVRFEIFYGITIAGLLHYMVTFNTSQRRMSLRVQLEIMKKPLIEHLKREQIPIWEDLGRLPGEQKPKPKFLASDLVLATQAFITNNAHVTAGFESERFLDESQPYLDNLGDICDVTATLKRITAELHPRLMDVYADNPNRRYLLSSGATFLVGFIAACGYIRNRGNMMLLDRALDKLMQQLDRSSDDPWNLETLEIALTLIANSRGKPARRLVDDTCRRFFLGVTTELEWLDTARQLTGTAA